MLFDKLLDQNIHPDLWLLVKNLYEGLTSKVKWMGKLSDSFNIKQGVRQRGLLFCILLDIYSRLIGRVGKKLHWVTFG